MSDSRVTNRIPSSPVRNHRSDPFSIRVHPVHPRFVLFIFDVQRELVEVLAGQRPACSGMVEVNGCGYRGTAARSIVRVTLELAALDKIHAIGNPAGLFAAMNARHPADESARRGAASSRPILHAKC